MMSDPFSPVVMFILKFIPAIIGIICHEVAHGWAAYRLGDPTAKMLGRLTLNPVNHIDPMGTAVFALTALANSPFIIGWAKPVPVQSRYFKNPNRDMMIVSLAGPLANILIAIICGLILRVSYASTESSVLMSGEVSLVTQMVLFSALFGIQINCMLAVFNLLPIPPLDGSYILRGLLPQHMAIAYEKINRYGFFIVIFLLATGLLDRVIIPIFFVIFNFVLAIVGLGDSMMIR